MASTHVRADRGSAATGFVVGVLSTMLAGLGAVQADVIDVTRAGTPGTAVSGTTQAAGSDRSSEDFETVYAEVSNGVVRLDNTRCEGEAGGTGSGALLSQDLVVTAAHVVAGHASLQVMLGDQTATGQVIGYDEGTDLALVRTSRPLSGHVFQPAVEAARVGAAVAAVGYPLSGPLSMAGPGIVSAYDESSTYPWWDGSEVTISDLMRTTVPTNPGNSGGPVVDRSGSLVGLVSGTRTSRTVDDQGDVDVDVLDGYKYAVTAERVAALTEQWMTTPQSLEPRECEAPSAPAPLELVTAQTGGPDTDVVLAVLFDYFDGINREDYERAYRQLSEERRRTLSLDRFRDEQSSSVVSGVVVLDTRREGEDLHAAVTFTSSQAPELGPDGLDCAFWLLDYRFVSGGEHGWSVAGSTELPDRPRFEPCTE